MKQLCFFVSIGILLICVSCYDNPAATSNEEAYPFTWRGSSETPVLAPDINHAYFNTALQTTFIWDGLTWDTLAISGIDKISMKWLGTFTTPPLDAQIDNVYFNSSENTSYIFNGTTWDTLTTSGDNTYSMVWKGSLTAPPLNPLKMWAYYDLLQRTTFIFNGFTWEAIAATGLNGTSMIWKGTLESAPLNPQLHWAYYNSSLQASYIFSDSGWQLICKDGTTGKKGNSIHWMGHLPTPPPYPEPYWAYFNTTNRSSYIYLNDSWLLMTASAKDGISVEWKGSHKTPPESAEVNWAYYNEVDKCSYIYTGQNWSLLCKDGKSGTNGLSVVWKGSLNTHPDKPIKNWAYYNYLEKKTYLYTGTEWITICIDGVDGINGTDGTNGDEGNDGSSVISTVYTETFYPNEELTLHHNKNSNIISFIGQFTYDSVVYNWTSTPYFWDNPYEVTQSKELYGIADSATSYKLLQRKNGTLIHYFNEEASAYKGLKFMQLSSEGTLGVLTSITSSSVSQYKALETDDQLYFLYINQETDTLPVISKTNTDGSISTDTISHEPCDLLNGISLPNGSIFICYSSVIDSSISYCIYNESGISKSDTLQYQNSTLKSYPYLDNNGNNVSIYSNGIMYTFTDSIIVDKVEFNSTELSTEPESNVLVNSNGESFMVLSRWIKNGKSIIRVFALCKFDQAGQLVQNISLGTFVRPGYLHFLPSGKIALTYWRSYKYTDGRSYHFRVINQNLQTCSHNSKLSNTPVNAQMAILSEEQIVMTYINDIQKDKLSFAILEKQEKKQSIDLIVVNSNTAKLINHTSFQLDNATLSLFGTKDDN